MRPLLRPGSVKICGLREPEHAITAASAGADLIGFIFAPSRRYVEPHDAREAIDAARRAASTEILAVGVFVNERSERMNEVGAIANLDLIQLSGDEPPVVANELNLPYLRGLRLPAGASAAEAAEKIERWRALVPAGFLLDGYHPGRYGGTGVQADWLLAAEIARSTSLLLAGGLTPANVGDAIRAAQPFGVDVAGGVEVDGRKSHDAIVAFIQRAKSTFAALER